MLPGNERAMPTSKIISCACQERDSTVVGINHLSFLGRIVCLIRYGNPLQWIDFTHQWSTYVINYMPPWFQGWDACLNIIMNISRVDYLYKYFV